MEILYDHIFNVRSTGRITAKSLMPLILMLKTSITLKHFDLDRLRPGDHLKFTAVQMVTILIYIEIKKFTFEEYKSFISGRGSQMILKNLGMPRGPNGRYIAPSTGWISDFRNHKFCHVMPLLEAELREDILKMMKKKGNPLIITVDSTPLEANRYSSWADYNVHYNIRMAKAHIIMINGVPLRYSYTNGNVADGPEFIRLLREFNGTELRGCRILSDGAYASHETYLEVFKTTGTVMSSNVRQDAVYHEEASYQRLIRLYNRMFREPGFISHKYVAPAHMLRFLANHDQADRVGWFLRNLDMMRGNRIHKKDARDRHVCETVHRAMKRWVDMDVRGLNNKYAEKRFHIRMFVCTLLSLAFKPYC